MGTSARPNTIILMNRGCARRCSRRDGGHNASTAPQKATMTVPCRGATSASDDTRHYHVVRLKKMNHPSFLGRVAPIPQGVVYIAAPWFYPAQHCRFMTHKPMHTAQVPAKKLGKVMYKRHSVTVPENSHSLDYQCAKLPRCVAKLPAVNRAEVISQEVEDLPLILSHHTSMHPLQVSGFDIHLESKTDTRDLESSARQLWTSKSCLIAKDRLASRVYRQNFAWTGSGMTVHSVRVTVRVSVLRTVTLAPRATHSTEISVILSPRCSAPGSIFKIDCIIR